MEQKRYKAGIGQRTISRDLTLSLIAVVLGVFILIGVLISALTLRQMEQTLQTQPQSILTIFAVISIPVLLTIFIGVQLLVRRFVSRPLDILAVDIDTIASGNYHYRLPDMPQVDVRFIVDRINIMAKAIEERDQELRRMVSHLEERVAERTQDLNLAAEIGQQVFQARNLDVLLPQAVRLILDQFGLYQTQIYLVDEAKQTLLLQASAGFAGEQLLNAGHELPIDQNSINGVAAFEKRPVIVADTRESDLFLAHPLLPDTRSEMVVPLIVKDQVVGVLDLQSEQPNTFSEENVIPFDVLGGQLAIAILNAHQNAEIRQSQEAMRANEVLMRTIIDSTPDWIFIKDINHRYQVVNQAYADSFNLTPADFIGKNDLEIGFPEEIVKGDAEKGIRGFWADDLEVMHSGEMKFIDEEPATIGGKPLFLSTIKAPLKDAQGKVIGVVGFVHDITARKETELQIQEREALMRTIIDSTPDWIFVKDREHRYVLANKGYADSLHRQPAEFIGKNDLDLGFPEEIVKGNVEKGIRGFWADDIEIFTTGESKVIDSEPAVLDGEPQYLNTIKAPLRNAQGEVVGVVGFVHNITERITAEKTLAKQATELQTVAEVSTRASTTLDPERLLQDVLNLSQERFHLYHAHIYLLDEAGENLRLTAGAGEIGRQMVAENRSIPVGQERSLVARAARSRQSIIVNDVQADPGFLPHPLLPDTRSEMATPLIAGEQLLGVLDVQANEINYFTEQDVQVYTALASQTAVALQNARQFEQTQAALTNADIFRQLANAATQGVSIATLNGAAVYINPSLARFFNSDDLQSDLKEIVLSELYPPEIQKQFQEEIIPHMLEHGSWQGELWLERDEGTIYTHQNHFLIRDDAGAPTHAAAIITDITKSKEAEAAIRESQTLMRTIIDAIPDWIIVKDKMHRYILVNQSFADSRQLSVDSFIGKTDLEIGFETPQVIDDPDMSIEDFSALNTAVMASGKIEEVEEQWSETNGIIRTKNIVRIPLQDTQDEVMGLVVLVHDITDEREAQKEQENLARELEEQLAQVNALQRAMAREGWAAFLANQDRGATGFSFAGDTVQPFNDASWLKSLSEMPLNLDELNTVSYDEKQTAVAMPLQIHGESVGVLGARNANGAPLDEEQQMLLATLTVQVAEALERARLFEETELGRQEIEAQAAELAIVNEISELVSSQLNLQSLVNAVGDRLIQTFSANSAYIALVNEKTKAINFPYFTNIIDGPLNISPRTLDDRGGFTAKIYQTQQPLIHNPVDQNLINSVKSDGGEVVESSHDSNSYIGVPMIVGETVIGVIGLNGQQDRRMYTDHDLPLLNTLASTIAVAVQNAIQFEEAQRRANREALVNEISQKIQNAPTIESAMQTAVTELGKALGVQRAVVELNKKPKNGQPN